MARTNAALDMTSIFEKSFDLASAAWAKEERDRRPPTAGALLGERLPPKTRRALGPELESVPGVVIVADRIHEAFRRCAKELTELRRFKRASGYCGGEPSCVTFVGKDVKVKLCEPCRKLARERDRQRGRPSTRRVSEYGAMRAKERALERAERERRG